MESDNNSSLSESDTELILECSSSSFNEDSNEEEDILHEEHHVLGLAPYQFEPEAEPLEQLEEAEIDHDEPRIERVQQPVNTWCICNKCEVMPTGKECLCCQEVDEYIQKCSEVDGPPKQCIVEHPGFQSVCLNVDVLQTAYFHYRQEYGHYGENDAVNERYRYIAYRQLVRWNYGYLGKHNRVILPSCAVMKIRQTFPAELYAGFKYPNLHFRD
ncbi:putative P2X purinoceptor 7-like [Apostichopus japonicus]|uniref:Putative P2X purinoceptor 7-like n=1 Tax=Stichopus japonicus TaxID=307972 RepID=A0A2G8JYM7_STIJA|nr:putative P2X purinoceptor 7-like [Apostichopus japonicus]PIK60740.1 putative P2X purinoceptor 7-like [Apostichopus japonicus]